MPSFRGYMGPGLELGGGLGRSFRGKGYLQVGKRTRLWALRRQNGNPNSRKKRRKDFAQMKNDQQV